MKFKEKEIGIPTVDMFDEYIKQKGFKLTGQEVYDYCKKKNWLTKKGTPMTSVEIMTGSYNGVVNQVVSGVVDKGGKLRCKLRKSFLKKLRKDVEVFVADCLPEEVLEYNDAIRGFRTLIRKHLNNQ